MGTMYLLLIFFLTFFQWSILILHLNLIIQVGILLKAPVKCRCKSPNLKVHFCQCCQLQIVPIFFCFCFSSLLKQAIKPLSFDYKNMKLEFLIHIFEQLETLNFFCHLKAKQTSPQIQKKREIDNADELKKGDFEFRTFSLVVDWA